MECPICKKPMVKVEAEAAPETQAPQAEGQPAPEQPPAQPAVETPAVEGDDVCMTECPHCKKPYHQHCWEQNIQAIKKCAFCMREPGVVTPELD